MKIEKTDKHSRTLMVTGIPKKHDDDPTELEISVNYTGDSNGLKGVTLDGHVVPGIISAFEALEDFCETIEATGGVEILDDGNATCAGDEEWIDLADSYLKACFALRRDPKIRARIR